MTSTEVDALEVNKLPTLESLYTKVIEEARIHIALAARGNNPRNNNGGGGGGGNNNSNRRDPAKIEAECRKGNHGPHTSETCWTLHPEQATDVWRERHKKRKEKEKQDKQQTQQQGNSGSGNNYSRGGIVDFAALAIIAVKPSILIAIDNYQDEFIADTGASNHMTNDLPLIVHYRQVDRKVQQAHGCLNSPITGLVRLPWVTSDGSVRQVLLKEVMFVPKLFTSLLSISKLRENGFYFHTGDDSICNMIMEEEIGSARLVGQHWLFNWDRSLLDTTSPVRNDVLETLPAMPHSTATVLATFVTIWHQRFGHLGFDNGFKTASMVDGLDIKKENLDHRYEACQLTTSHRHVNHKPVPPKKQVLELFHTTFWALLIPRSWEASAGPSHSLTTLHAQSGLITTTRRARPLSLLRRSSLDSRHSMESPSNVFASVARSMVAPSLRHFTSAKASSSRRRHLTR